MKKLLPAALLLLATTTFAQQSEPLAQPAPQVDYLKISKTQKTVGLILLGAGIVGLISTTSSLVADDMADDIAYDIAATFGLPSVQPEPSKSNTAIFVVSGVAMFLSVPLLVSAEKNKKRGMAASATLKMQKMPTLQAGTLKNQSYPSLALRVDL